MAYKDKKSWGRKPDEANSKVSVAEIVVDKIIQKIQSEGKLPWQKPFLPPAINWFTEWEYTGINVLLLPYGEYITKKQLEQYNEKNKTSFWFKKGCTTDVVTFFAKKEKVMSNGEFEAFKSRTPDWAKFCYPTDRGWVRSQWIQRYYRVFNIEDIEDKEGNKLDSKLGKTIIMETEEPQKIVDRYLKASGVTIRSEGVAGEAYFSRDTDMVTIPPERGFKSTENYYRTLFHELIHSTGVEKRLNRECYRDYHNEMKERGKEELIAELGSVILATEAGFKEEDNEWNENSANYIAGWVRWMKDNPNLVMSGATQAQKAATYLLSGCTDKGGGNNKATDGSNSSGEEDDFDGTVGSSGSVPKSKPVGSNKDTDQPARKPTNEPEIIVRGTGTSDKVKKDAIKYGSGKTYKEMVSLVETKEDAKTFRDNVLKEILEGNLDKEQKQSEIKGIHISQLVKVYTVLKGEKPEPKSKKSDILKGIMEG